MPELTQINVYQEQSYLLDPYLEDIVVPPARALQALVCETRAPWVSLTPEQQGAMSQFARLLYVYTKVRGYKLVSRFLSHDIGDLIPVLTVLESATDARPPWEVLYVLLLWLALLALVPFQLEQASDTQLSLAQRIEHVARMFLGSSGKERDGASVVLGHLYRRKDAASLLYAPFLAWARTEIQSTQSPFLATGLLQTLCAMTKNSDAPNVLQHYEELLALLNSYAPWEHKSALVDHYRVKLRGRLARQLLAISRDDERVDDHVDALLRALSHADTRVRYSSAKALARVCMRLPSGMTAQVLETLFDALAENVRMAATPANDISNELEDLDLDAVSESTWHGVHLALAECVRRGCVVDDALMHRVVVWTLQVRQRHQS